MRSLLRSLSRGQRIWKRLPSDLGGGKICCSPEAMLSVWKPGWASRQARDLFAWARRYVKPGMCVWDLGANQGLFTFAAAARAGEQGHVFGFEPDPFLLALLDQSLASSSHKGASVDVMPLALSHRIGIGQFLIAQTDRTLNHLASAKGNPRTGGARSSRSVMLVTLDWLAEQLGPPDLIKIDVEGGEAHVLRGARALLKRDRPVVIIEVAHECAESVALSFAEANYLMFDIESPQLGPIPDPAWNTLAVPAERAHALF